MRVFIAGCRGMLGSDLMARFSRDHRVLGGDLPDMDITDPGQCRARIGGFQPDVVINAAALTRVDYCEAHEGEAFEVNGHGPRNLARAAASAGAFFVHYSTDYVFDGLKREAYLEEDDPNPRSVYGRSKLAGEELVRQNCPHHLIIRTSWLFGRNGPNFVRTIFEAARRGEPLRVVHDQRGSPTYSADVASHTLRMIEAGCRLTYHLTNRGSCTWYELAVTVLEYSGMKDVPVTPVSTLEFPRPAPRPANSVLANAHLQRDGLPLMRPWKEAVKDYIENHLLPDL